MASSLRDQKLKQAGLWKDIKIQPYPRTIDELGPQAYKNKIPHHQRRLGDEGGCEMMKGRPKLIGLGCSFAQLPFNFGQALSRL